MIDRFPSFAGLKAFYAVSASGGVVAAAERLGISSSAISHQLRNLETELGIRLFSKNNGKLLLTADGAKYFQAIERPLETIREATDDIRSAPGRRRVTVTLTPSFAANWLMPRMRDLSNKHPDLELNLVTTTRVLDIGREKIDLAIRRGKGRWPGLKTEFLMGENIVPVLSPDLWKTINVESLDNALKKSRALINTTIPGEWDDWCAACDIEPPCSKQRFNLETYELSVQAACDGLGIALGRRPLIDKLLANGELVSPFTDVREDSVSYYLLWQNDMSLSSPAKRFSGWLRSQNEIISVAG